MDRLFIELTNACNRRCLHCLRNKADHPGYLPLALAREVFSQARALGFQRVCLTGGEVALYPYLEEFLALVVDYGFTFNLVTNGHRFRENLLPLLSSPKIRGNLTEVCFSLDGARPDTHDALRGPGSFREVVEAATLCQFKEIPLSLKSVITNFNKEELTDLALLGTTLEAQDHSFLQLFPTPRSIREGVILTPDEVSEKLAWVAGSLAKAFRSKISIEASGPRTTLFSCANIQRAVYIDFQGNLVLCCNLSHVTREEGQPSVFGRECLADLKEVTLQEGIIRQFHAVAQLMEARLLDGAMLRDLTLDPCYWCFRHFGKLEWLRDFPDSPWAAGVLEEDKGHAYA
jgi:MoaA/NifB/PqqE/SkfB family radical SAM enzyme